MQGPEHRFITIPSRDEHCGLFGVTISVPWVCIHCGGPRGEPTKGLSFDGSKRLEVDTWRNPCKHVERYSEVRAAYVKANPIDGIEDLPAEPVGRVMRALIKLTDAVENRQPEHEGYLQLCAQEARAIIEEAHR